MSEIVQKLELNNITVIIDAHQDMFSRLFCGEGAPKFYTEKLSYSKDCNTNLISKFFGYQLKCLLIGCCVYIPNNQKPFFIFHQHVQEFSKQ